VIVLNQLRFACVLSIAAAIGLSGSGNLYAQVTGADPARGRQLYENNCGDCHYERVHQRARDKSLIKTRDDLRTQVSRWGAQTKQPLTGQDIADIVQYLDLSHYRLLK